MGGNKLIFAAAISALIAYAALGVESKSLQSVFDEAAASGKKELKLSGVYFLDAPLRLTKKHSGIYAEGSPRVTLIAGKKINAWVQDGKFLKAQVDAENISALFVNGKRAVLARHPNFATFFVRSPASNKDGKENAYTISADVLKADIAPLLTAAPADREGACAEVLASWNHARFSVVGLSENAGEDSARITLESDKNFSLFGWEKAPRYYLSNFKGALDAEGEFWFDRKSKTLYYIPLKGQGASNLEAFYPVLPTAAIFGGESFETPLENFTLKNASFLYGADAFYESGRYKFTGTQAAFFADSFVVVKNAKNIAFVNCRIAHCEGYGLGFESGARFCAVTDSEIYDAGSGGIRVGRDRSNVYPSSDTDPALVSNITIKNNIVYGWGRRVMAGVGILVADSGNNIVEDNAVFDGFYTGISVGWTWGDAKTHTQNNVIRGNKIFKIGYGWLSDMGGIYTLGTSTGSVLEGNEIYEVTRHRYGAWGIYNDEGSADFVITKNYVHDTQDCPYFMHYGKNVLVKNNLFVNGATSQVGLGRQYENSFIYTQNIAVYSAPPSTFLRDDRYIPEKFAHFEKNIYFNRAGEVRFGQYSFAEWQEKGQDAGTVIEDPNLKNFTPSNPVLKKAGFETFALDVAGPKGLKRARLNDILKNYAYAAQCQDPVLPDFDLFSVSDFGNLPAGSAPKFCHILNEPSKKDIIVRADKDNPQKRFIRFSDSEYKETWKPAAAFTQARLSRGYAYINFEVRLNADSDIKCVVRGDGSDGNTATLSFSSGGLETAKGFVKLPLNKWLKVQIRMGVGQNASNSWSYEVKDAAAVLASGADVYPAKPVKEVDWVGFLMPSNSACSADISEVYIHSKAY